MTKTTACETLLHLSQGEESDGSTADRAALFAQSLAMIPLLIAAIWKAQAKQSVWKQRNCGTSLDLVWFLKKSLRQVILSSYIFFSTLLLWCHHGGGQAPQNCSLAPKKFPQIKLCFFLCALCKYVCHSTSKRTCKWSWFCRPPMKNLSSQLTHWELTLKSQKAHPSWWVCNSHSLHLSQLALCYHCMVSHQMISQIYHSKLTVWIWSFLFFSVAK